ncbi:Alg9-like mannosyltransferase family-domain-containing protein [Amylostereum chailletii]|nr:Alg9-like mannosyltransferase family-domain-containing protein [Amylostereum chailletii]
MSVAQDLLILAVGWTHVLLAPYTKVEESFNLHATHDVLMYGVLPDALPNYDHFTFSGAVPRSFVGSLALAALSTPVLHLATTFAYISFKFDVQIILRLVLATINALALCLIRRAVSRRYGRPTGLLFTLLTCTQFHLPFWMGRTLPNMFALFPVNIATYLLLDREKNALRASRRSVTAALALLTFTAVVFRSEVALFLAPIALQSLFNRSITFTKLLKVGLVSGLTSIGTFVSREKCVLDADACVRVCAALTVAVDSYFWARFPLWPELAGVYFNVYQGKSSEWGVSPPHAYFSSHLPKLLLGALPLSVLGFLVDPRARATLLPALVFVGLISALGHKEWRFVVYVVPVFNVAAARGARSLVGWRKSSLLGRLAFLSVAGLLALNAVATCLTLQASIANYPGGVALARFNALYADAPHVHVHISNLAAQTGASLFLHTRSPPFYVSPFPSSPSSSPSSSSPQPPGNWTYDKTEHLTPASLTAGAYTHLLSETPALGRAWKVAEGGGEVEGFVRWAVERDVRGLVAREGWRGLLVGLVRMERTGVLWILERAG